MLVRCRRWLASAQNANGSWGAAPAVNGTIEETALAVEALARTWRLRPNDAAPPAGRGLAWLQTVTDNARDFPAAPIGLYFARLWYKEALYPVIFTAAACEAHALLERALEHRT